MLAKSHTCDAGSHFVGPCACSLTFLPVLARLNRMQWRHAERCVSGCGRGLAELDANKNIKQLFLEDFPYAEDGLLVWKALVEYFTGYLSLYYSDSGAGGKPKVPSCALLCMPTWVLFCLRPFGSLLTSVPGRGVPAGCSPCHPLYIISV